MPPSSSQRPPSIAHCSSATSTPNASPEPSEPHDAKGVPAHARQGVYSRTARVAFLPLNLIASGAGTFPSETFAQLPVPVRLPGGGFRTPGARGRGRCDTGPVRRNLVIVRAGDTSLHENWLAGPVDRNWDLIVSYYGDDPERFRAPDV